MFCIEIVTCSAIDTSLNDTGPTMLDRWSFKRHFEKLLVEKWTIA